jgi:pimeloyl-ACP methyl ester carboxylesterase
VAAGWDYYKRTNGAPLPEGDFLAIERFAPNGRDLGPETPGTISAQVIKSAESVSPPFDSVRVPVLAIYNWPETVQQAFPWMVVPDSLTGQWLQLSRGWYDAQRAEFAAAVPQARIIVVPGASHYVFVGRADTVARAMRAFLTGP